MVVGLLTGSCAASAILATSRRYIGLAPDDRFDSFLLHRVVESDRAVHVSMIGHGTRVHPQFLGSFCQRVYLDRTV